MKHKTLLPLLLLLLLPLTLPAQSTVKFGTLHFQSLLHSMPEWKQAQAQVDTLQLKLEREALYNAEGFRRKFADLLAGQKDFPESIMLRRQRDLQQEMEKTLAFRAEADTIVSQARESLLGPVRESLMQAIRQVGMEGGYECIIDLDNPALPFVHPSLCEDVTQKIIKALNR